jgi:sugar/nucleoside kinase (ribokinase family)
MRLERETALMSFFLYADLNEMDLKSCLVLGSVCVALSALCSGGIASQPTVEKAKRFLQDGNHNLGELYGR